jgi:hypothetical protein
MSADSTRLTGDNTNAWGHRVVGDTLVYESAECEYGEVAVTEMIEESAGRCPDCGPATNCS